MTSPVLNFFPLPVCLGLDAADEVEEAGAEVGPGFDEVVVEVVESVGIDVIVVDVVDAAAVLPDDMGKHPQQDPEVVTRLLGEQGGIWKEPDSRQ